MVVVICAFVLGLQAPGLHVYKFKANGEARAYLPFTISLDQTWHHGIDSPWTSSQKLDENQAVFERASPSEILLRVFTRRSDVRTELGGYTGPPAYYHLYFMDHLTPEYLVDHQNKGRSEIFLYSAFARQAKSPFLGATFIGLVREGKSTALLEFVSYSELNAGVILKAVKGFSFVHG